MILGESQFVGDKIVCPVSCTTNISHENGYDIKKGSSRIRVLFATTALGMGVNISHVSTIIHIGPPSSLEAYIQGIGRAGHNGRKSSAVMFYNNSDIAKNKDNVDDEDIVPMQLLVSAKYY